MDVKESDKGWYYKVLWAYIQCSVHSQERNAKTFLCTVKNVNYLMFAQKLFWIIRVLKFQTYTYSFTPTHYDAP